MDAGKKQEERQGGQAAALLNRRMIMGILKDLWRKYMEGTRVIYFPISKCGLFGGKLKNPGDLSEALDALEYLLTPEVKEYATNWSEEKWTARTHSNIGRMLRNDWKLWAGSKLSKWFNRRGIKHPDDMSGIILTTYYRNVHYLPIKLEEQIQHYIEYWKTLKA